MRPAEFEEMRKLDLFAGSRPETVEALLRGALMQLFPSHAEVVREGDPADFLHVIVSGVVEIFAKDRDRETTVAIVGPAHTFIMAAVFLDRPYLKSARVLEPARILMVPAEPIRALAKVDIGLAYKIAEELANAYRGVVQELKNQKLRSGLERLANWVVRRDIETGSKGTFTIPFDKKILAAHLGMTPEVLSRSFATLAKYDVRVDGRKIRIGDSETLLRLAKPSPLIDDPSA